MSLKRHQWAASSRNCFCPFALPLLRLPLSIYLSFYLSISLPLYLSPSPSISPSIYPFPPLSPSPALSPSPPIPIACRLSTWLSLILCLSSCFSLRLSAPGRKCLPDMNAGALGAFLADESSFFSPQWNLRCCLRSACRNGNGEMLPINAEYWAPGMAEVLAASYGYRRCALRYPSVEGQVRQSADDEMRCDVARGWRFRAR